MTDAWARAAAAAARARLVVVIGESDVGKSTLVARLASGLATLAPVAVIDADLGQSEIGPPATVGLGRVTAPITRLAEAEPLALAFVGSFSPARDLLASVVAAARMVDRGRAARFDRLLVDTSGLVAGDLGRRLKQAKIELLGPDLVICLEHRDECEHILRPYRSGRPEVLRLSPLPGARRRSQDARRRRRHERLAAWLEGGRLVALDLERVVLRAPPLGVGTPIERGELDRLSAALDERLVWGERHGKSEVAIVSERPLLESQILRLRRELGRGTVEHWALADLEGRLVGLEDDAHATLGIGVLRRLDLVAHVIEVETRVAAGTIAAVTVGRERDPGGEPRTTR